MLISGLIHSHHIKQCLPARILLCLAGSVPWVSFFALLAEMSHLAHHLSAFQLLPGGSGSPKVSSSLWGQESCQTFLPSLLTTVSGKTWLYCLSNKGTVVGERELMGNNVWTVSDWTRWKMACRWPVASALPPGPLAVREHYGVFSLCVQQSIPDSHCQFLKIGI